MNRQFWISLTTLFLACLYQTVLGALATQVPGFTLPPVVVYTLSVLGPVVLLAMHAMPSVFAQLGDATKDPDVTSSGKAP